MTYDSGDGTQARIRLVRDGQDLGQIHAATTSKGTLKHTVVVGHTYVFRLIAFSENRGSSLSRTVAETTVKAMQGRFNGCEGPCIRRVLSQALGTYAELLVDTLVPTSLIVSVSEKAPRADGTFEKVSWAGFSLAPSREHFVRPTGLAPDTRHFYIVIAKDARGATHRRVGSFVTQMRRATIHFEEIKLFDDSDSTGAGELTFAFFAGKPGEPSFMEAVRPADGWKSGSTYFPNRTLRIDDAPDEIPVLVVGRDDDTSPVEVQSCGTKMSWFPPIETPFGGCIRVLDWEFGWVRRVLEVARPGPDPGESFVEKFAWRTTRKSYGTHGEHAYKDVDFVVRGRVVVEYLNR